MFHLRYVAVSISILVSSILMQYQGNTKCGENEIFSTCTTACPLTCENWAHPPTVCEKLCVSGCTCLEGSVEYRGRCVLREKCPKPPFCYHNETFQNDGGYDCANCRNYKSVKCLFNTQPGCYCKPGYIRNIENEDCILVKDCPLDSICQENQSYQEGGYDCANCSNLSSLPCQFKDQAGCYCKPGYVWDSDACTLIKNCQSNEAERPETTTSSFS